MIKVLMISTDRKIFEKGSPVFERMIEYEKLFKELHIVVFATQDLKLPSIMKISENTFAYATNSISKLLYVKDAEKIGCDIIHDAKLLEGNSVITTQDPFETGHVGRGLSKRSKIPLHVQIHTDFYSPYFKKSLLNKVRIALSKRVLPQAKVIRTVSDRIRSSLPKDMQSKASVLPIFLDVTSIRETKIVSSLKKKYPHFSQITLVASRLTKEKDIMAALYAFSMARVSKPNIGLVIVGEGGEEQALRQEVKKLNLGNSVVFEPWVNLETLVSYMKTCDVFISASLYEGYGLSMLEAHMSGALIVATNAGIAPLLVAPELLVSPGDGNGLGKALIKALNGGLVNKDYVYPYQSKEAYFEAYKRDIERALV